MSTDEYIINGLIERCGLESARRYAQQTLRVYRRPLLNPWHFASTVQYRRGFIVAYLPYKRHLRSFALPTGTGGTPPPKPPASSVKPARTPSPEDCERMIDDELAGSFPASDPPSWTLGGSIASQRQLH